MGMLAISLVAIWLFFEGQYFKALILLLAIA